MASPSELVSGPPRGEILPGGRELYLYRKKDPSQPPEPANLVLIAALRQGLLEELDLPAGPGRD